MKRKCLTRKIRALDRQLIAQHLPFRQRSSQSMAAFRQINPLWLVAAGLLAGAVVGRLGWRRAYTTGAAGFRLYPLLQTAGTALASLRYRA